MVNLFSVDALLEKDVKVVVYSGQLDLIVDTIGKLLDSLLIVQFGCVFYRFSYSC